VRAYDVAPDPTAVLAVDGPPQRLTMVDPGQNGRLTFHGWAGQPVRLTLSDVTIIDPNCGWPKPTGGSAARTAR